MRVMVMYVEQNERSRSNIFGQGRDVFIRNLFFFKWKFVVIFKILIMTSYGYSNVFLM